MLRAIGMTRRQVRRMIRHESIVTALIGATLGIVVGMFLAVITTFALSTTGSCSRCRSRRSPCSSSWRSSPACWRRSCRRAAPRGSTCWRRCSMSSGTVTEGRRSCARPKQGVAPPSSRSVRVVRRRRSRGRRAARRRRQLPAAAAGDLGRRPPLQRAHPDRDPGGGGGDLPAAPCRRACGHGDDARRRSGSRSASPGAYYLLDGSASGRALQRPPAIAAGAFCSRPAP